MSSSAEFSKPEMLTFFDRDGDEVSIKVDAINGCFIYRDAPASLRFYFTGSNDSKTLTFKSSQECEKARRFVQSFFKITTFRP
jgi:hypothetical protein